MRKFFLGSVELSFARPFLWHISLHLSLIVKGIFYIFTKNQTQMQGNLTENGPQMKAQQNLRLVTINRIGLAMFLLVLSGHQVANATAAGVGVRAQSLGEAYRAVASANDIIYYNPAGLIRDRHTGADADYLTAPDARLHSLGVSVVDSKTTAWGLGIAYNAGIAAQSETPTTHLAYVALAMPLGTDQIAIGAGFSYLYDARRQDLPYKNFFNIDVGLLADLGSGFRFALVLDHLLESKGAEKSLGLSVGSAFALGDLFESLPLTASFDWTMKDLKSQGDLDHVLGLGFEYLAYRMVPIRVGYSSALKEHNRQLSLGTGIVTDNFVFDALYQQNLAIGKIRQFGLAVRIKI